MPPHPFKPSVSSGSDRPPPEAATADLAQAETTHTPPPSGAEHPERIGPYAVRGVIGEGGFGIVYAADQDAPLRRRVALKVIKPGMDSHSVIARFEAERQALAVMDHPGVARVFDGGTVPAGEPGAGRPFFVMEYVAGEPITGFCDRRRMPIDERVELFIQVCEAVQHAHTKAVIHRDIKPGNILVTYADGGARAKVIDFGIAKALNQRLCEATIFTERGQMIGTPEYMSPEQAEMSGLDIDTRSDVYSLGVVLYELLSGVRPFNLRDTGLFEIQRTLREEVPEKPSTRVRRLRDSAGDPGTLARIAEARGSTPSRIARDLRGELDTIVSICLRKERSERYDSASELAADLRRYLSGEPVQGRPMSGVRQALRLARRHDRWLSTVMLMLSFCLMLFAQVWVLAIVLTSLPDDPSYQRWIETQNSELLPPLESIQAVFLIIAILGLVMPFVLAGLAAIGLAVIARTRKIKMRALLSALLALVIPAIEMFAVSVWLESHGTAPAVTTPEE